jgi:hypothetical protein
MCGIKRSKVVADLDPRQRCRGESSGHVAEADEFQIPLVWEETEDRPAIFANNFLVQHQPDEFVLTVGQVLTPPLVGTPEERRAQLDRVSYVPIRILGRFAFTRRRMVELIAVLQQNLERHDATMRRLEERGEEPSK